MNNQHSRKIDRRMFLKDSTATLAAGVGWFASLREVLGQAQQSGKPLLTDKAINALVPEKPTALFRRRAAEALKDPRAFIRKHFYLTAVQRKELADLSAEQIAEIRKAIRTALDKNYKLEVKIEHLKTARSLGPKEASSQRTSLLFAPGTMPAGKLSFGCEAGATVTPSGEPEFEGKCTVKYETPK